MRGIPGKEREAVMCPCGHPMSEHITKYNCRHQDERGFYTCMNQDCAKTPADLQPKECDHLWASDTWGTYCCKCGIRVGKSTADTIRPEKPVEPAEKRYIVRELFKADDTYNFENAKTHAMIAAKKHHGKYIVALIVGESTHKVESIEWHEEQ